MGIENEAGMSGQPRHGDTTSPAGQGRKTRFQSVRCSLSGLVGEDYIGSVCAARAFLTGEEERTLLDLATEEVEFYPQAFYERLVALLPEVGSVCCAPMKGSAEGAGSDAFRANSSRALAPQTCLGYLRVGEDGRLFLTSKSAHYHAPLGHSFPGYALLERARRLGIPNATHNNTRGHITRLLEEELLCHAAGIACDDAPALDALRASERPHDLNRVLNLVTGSLAAEAAVKMVLARFHKVQADSAAPRYAGRTPVLLVMADDEGGLGANYHGTTTLTQMMRGMWPDLLEALEGQGALLVRAVRRNRLDELEAAFETYEKPPYKIAGAFHELLLMNYGAGRLSDAFVQRLYALCDQHDVPTVVDEIQTCVWSPEIFLFREYGVRPTMVVLGKGFSGGEFAASRILFSAAVDNLPQFGALVTNGQEELASLAYLITMRWAEANAEVTRAVGDYYEERLNGLAGEFPGLITAIEGKRHMAGIYFADLAPAKAFVQRLQRAGLDVSVQAYKESCPPSALTKLPLTAGFEVVDFVADRMGDALRRLDDGDA